MKPTFDYTRIEPYVFVAVLLVSVFPVITNTYFATLDGPAHLYNATLLTHYASNPVISSYYVLNSTPSPNLFGHLSLSFLSLLFSSAASEKLLVLFYFISFPFGFRYFVKCYSPQNVFFSIIAIPLSHSCLAYMGFYNFSISYTFLFWALGLYYVKLYKPENTKPVHYLLLFVLTALTYLSGVLSFAYLLAVIGLFELHKIVQLVKMDQKQLIIGRLTRIILVVLPSCICLLIFYVKMSFPPDDSMNDPKELLDFLFYFKSLTVYNVGTDMLYTRILLGVLLFLVLFIFFKYRLLLQSFFKRHAVSLVFLFMTMPILAGYFIIPNGSSAGMMTDRLCNLWFVSLVLWIGCQQEIRLPKFVSLIIIVPHFFLLQIHSKEQETYNKIALGVVRSSEHIEANSTVLPVNLLQKWLFVTAHFPDYLGTKKPLIILDNYEAAMPWFPVNWNLETMPDLTLNHKSKIENTEWPQGNRKMPSKEIDYVYLLGDIHDLLEEQWQPLKSNLDSAYTVCYLDQENKISIYKHN